MYIIPYLISPDSISASISHWLEGKSQLYVLRISLKFYLRKQKHWNKVFYFVFLPQLSKNILRLLQEKFVYQHLSIPRELKGRLGAGERFFLSQNKLIYRVLHPAFLLL